MEGMPDSVVDIMTTAAGKYFLFMCCLLQVLVRGVNLITFLLTVMLGKVAHSFFGYI